MSLSDKPVLKYLIKWMIKKYKIQKKYRFWLRQMKFDKYINVRSMISETSYATLYQAEFYFFRKDKNKYIQENLHSKMDFVLL